MVLKLSHQALQVCLWPPGEDFFMALQIMCSLQSLLHRENERYIRMHFFLTHSVSMKCSTRWLAPQLVVLTEEYKTVGTMQSPLAANSCLFHVLTSKISFLQDERIEFWL